MCVCVRVCVDVFVLCVCFACVCFYVRLRAYSMRVVRAFTILSGQSALVACVYM